MTSETGGIALLSMYNDEEDEDEELEEAPAASRPEPTGEAADVSRREEAEGGGATGTPPDPSAYGAATPPLVGSRTPLANSDEGPTNYNETLESPVARSPTPPPFAPPQRFSPFPSVSASPSPARPPAFTFPEPLDSQRIRKGPLAIVDYAHDEMAMSPETEEGELLSNGGTVFGIDVQVSEMKREDRTPPGTVHILAPNTQLEPVQPSVPEQSRNEVSMQMDCSINDAEVAEVEVTAVVSIEVQKQDSLSTFLPPPLTIKCSEELQEKINKFLAYKRAGKSFNADLRNRKDYRNPDFLQHAVRYQDIDQIGSCFSKDVFDPHGYDKSDYYDEIENEMRREIERKEQERKKSQKVEFVSGGTQPTAVVPTPKMTTHNPVATIPAAANTGFSSVSMSDAVGKDIRQSKKSKWDKIDGDVKNTSQDNASTVGVHAAILTAATAGAGYTAFAQLKRKEAEEKRSSDRKFDKRS